MSEVHTTSDASCASCKLWRSEGKLPMPTSMASCQIAVSTLVYVEPNVLEESAVAPAVAADVTADTTACGPETHACAVHELLAAQLAGENCALRERFAAQLAREDAALVSLCLALI